MERRIFFLITGIILSLGLTQVASADPQLSANTCGVAAASSSLSDPFTTAFPVTVNAGDTVLSVVIGYRAIGKTIASVSFGTQSLTKSAGTLGNTMGAEIWSVKNPTATTSNVLITYTNGGTFVFDRACARTFTGVDMPLQPGVTFTTANASAGINLSGLVSTGDKSMFVDIAACNCGGMQMVQEPNRTLQLNFGPYQIGSSMLVKSPAGTDQMPWTAPAVQATAAGVIYPPLAVVSGTGAVPQLSSNTCASPGSSASSGDPFTTTFPVTVKSGDTMLSVVIGYRAVGKTVATVVFNGSQSLTKSAGTLGNTMGAEIWSLKNPLPSTGNILITYTNGGTFVLDRACARTFTGVDMPVQAGATFTTSDASAGISLTGLTSTNDNSVFVDIAACNCGGLHMVQEPSRTLQLNSGPNQIGSSMLIKSPAGTDTMPWTAGAVQATAAGVIYPTLATTGTNAPPVVSAGANQNITANIVVGDPKLTSTTCASPAASVSVADPFTTMFPVTVKAGDSLLSVVIGYRAAGKTVASIVFNGNQNLIKSAGTLDNTMGAEIWSLKNPAATTGNVVITYTNGGVFVFDRACARTFAGVDLPVQSGVTFSTANASGGVGLSGLTSVSDKSVFVDIAACNCGGGLFMVPEQNRTLQLNAGPNQVGSSAIVVKSPPGTDTMPWAPVAAAVTQAGVVYPPLGITVSGVMANLSGSASDDGLPNGILNTTWSQVSGPGIVTFANANLLNTAAAFSLPGTYVLRLTASDTVLSSTSDTTISINVMPVQSTENGFSVMATALNMQGQPNWFFYNSGDAPEGAYMGWLFQAPTLAGTVQLPRQLAPGRYYIFFYGISYDQNPTIQATIGGGTSSTVTLNDRDANRYWSNPAIIDVVTPSNTLQVLLTRNPAISSDQRYLFRGLYITDNAGITMTSDGYAVNLTYPVVMDDSPAVKGNLVPNGGFEIPIDAGWSFIGQGAGRTVPINTMWDTTAYEGQGSLKLTFDSATRIRATRLTETFMSRVYHLKPNRKYTVSMWMKTSPGFSTNAIVSLVNAFTPPPGYPAQHFISSPATLITETWTRVSVTGYLLAYPTSDYQIFVQVPGPSGNYLLIDDVQLEEGDLTNYAATAPVEAGVAIDLGVKPGNIFYNDEALQVDMVERNNTSTTQTKTLRYEIYDQLNSVVSQGSLPLSIPALTTLRTPFNLSTGAKQGIFRLVTWIEGSDRTERELTYSIIPRPATTTFDLTSSLGIHPNYSDFQFKMVQRMGMKWARSLSPAAFCRWSVVEPTQGQFVWDDEHIQLANNYGLMTMCTIGVNNDWPAWANNGGLPDLAKWRDFVSQVVSHYKPYVKDWEIWNEPYAVFPSDFYAQMLKVAIDTIESIDPTARIVGGGGSPINYLQALINSLQTQNPGWDWKQHVDVMSSHDYPDGVPPETLKPLMDTYNIPVWNTEAGGWDLGFYQGVNSNFVSWGKTAWPNADAARYYEGTTGAASIVTQNYLRTMATGQSKYFYYDSRYYAAPNYFTHHPTILEYDGTVRAKGITYAIAGSLVDHSAGLGNASSDPNSFFLVFDKSSGPIAALFSADNQSRQVTISLGSGQFQVLDTMGNLLPSGSVVRYGRTPTYLKGIGVTASALKAALQSGVITVPTDTMPPNLSISDAPRGPIVDHNFRVRWIAVDDVSFPNLGEINPATNTASTPNPNAIVYSYYLNGYSTAWSNWDAGTYVDFTNVPSGTYTFSVVCRDAAGNQSPAVSRTIVIN